MEKKIYEKQLGGDGLVIGAYVDEKNASISLRFPMKEVVSFVADKALVAIDKAIDKVEDLIPGDQKDTAAKLKQRLRDELAKFVADQVF